jgi:hypothetical protein
MPSVALLQIERRLSELACPPEELRRKVRELAEHHEDLKRDALEEGLSEAEAEARADALLGEPVVLAEHLAASLRQSSWWGRHPIIGFCLVPPFAIIALFMLTMTLEYGFGRLWLTSDEIGGVGDWETGLKYCYFGLLGTHYAVEIPTALLFCSLARRTVAGFRWAFIACAMLALHGALFFISLVSHNITVGYTTQMHWFGALLPLFIAALVWLKARGDINRLPALPVRDKSSRSKPVALPRNLRSRFITPSSVITTLLIAALIVMIHRYIPVKHQKVTAEPATPAASKN